jgi:hypothetical protein
VPPAIDTILAGARGRGGDSAPQLTPEDAVRLENLALADYLGSGRRDGARTPGGT